MTTMTGNYIGPPGNAQVPSMPFYPSFVGIMLLLLYGVKLKEGPFFHNIFPAAAAAAGRRWRRRPIWWRLGACVGHGATQ